MQRVEMKTSAFNFDEKKILLVVFLVFLFFRIPTLDFYLHGDEGDQIKFVSQKDITGLPAHPPLNIFLLSLSLSAFDLSNWSARLPYFVFSILSFFMLYLICRRWISGTAALWSVFLLSISTWHIWSSHLIHMDGSLLQFAFLLSAYLYFMWKDTGQKKYLFLTGLAVALGGLAKLPGLMAMIFIGLYELYEVFFVKPDMLNRIKSLAIISISAIVSFSLVFLLLLNYFGIDLPTFLSYMFGHNTNFVKTFILQDWTHLLFLLVQTIFLAFPLLVFSAIRILNLDGLGNIFKPGKKPNLPIFFSIWIAFVLFFYLFVITSPVRPLEQYLMVIVPALCGLFGYGLSKLSDSKRLLVALTLLSAGLFIVFYILSALPGEFLPLHPRSELAERFISFDWNFYFPFHSSSGPLGFFVKTSVIGLSILASLMAIVLLVLTLKKRLKIFRPSILLMLAAVIIAQNAQMSLEYSYSLTTPDLSKADAELIDALTIKKYEEPIFLYYQPSEIYIPQYANKTYFDVGREEDTRFISRMQDEAKTIAVFDFQIMNKDSALWKAISSCDLDYSYTDEYRTEAYIFSC